MPWQLHVLSNTSLTLTAFKQNCWGKVNHKLLCIVGGGREERNSTGERIKKTEEDDEYMIRERKVEIFLLLVVAETPQTCLAVTLKDLLKECVQGHGQYLFMERL